MRWKIGLDEQSSAGVPAAPQPAIEPRTIRRAAHDQPERGQFARQHRSTGRRSTVTVTLGDTNGLLSANTTAPGGGTLGGSGTTNITIIGSLTAVDADLSTLSYLFSTPRSDTITANVGGTYGRAGVPATFTVQTIAPPEITAPAATVSVVKAPERKSLSEAAG